MVLFQCPASFAPSEANIGHLREFLSRIDRRGLRLAWEPRGQWTEGTIEGLCRELDLLHGVDPFKNRQVTKGPVYFRLHGISGYRYRYTQADLRRLLEWCRGREGYVLFNNVAMLEDARRFKALLEAENGGG